MAKPKNGTIEVVEPTTRDNIVERSLGMADKVRLGDTSPAVASSYARNVSNAIRVIEIEYRYNPPKPALPPKGNK